MTDDRKFVYHYDEDDDRPPTPWNWPRAVASVVTSVVVLLLIAMCAGWMPWQQ